MDFSVIYVSIGWFHDRYKEKIGKGLGFGEIHNLYAVWNEKTCFGDLICVRPDRLISRNYIFWELHSHITSKSWSNIPIKSFLKIELFELSLIRSNDSIKIEHVKSNRASCHRPKHIHFLLRCTWLSIKDKRTTRAYHQVHISLLATWNLSKNIEVRPQIWT